MNNNEEYNKSFYVEKYNPSINHRFQNLTGRNIERLEHRYSFNLVPKIGKESEFSIVSVKDDSVIKYSNSEIKDVQNNNKRSLNRNENVESMFEHSLLSQKHEFVNDVRNTDEQIMHSKPVSSDPVKTQSKISDRKSELLNNNFMNNKELPQNEHMIESDQVKTIKAGLLTNQVTLPLTTSPQSSSPLNKFLIRAELMRCKELGLDFGLLKEKDEQMIKELKIIGKKFYNISTENESLKQMIESNKFIKEEILRLTEENQDLRREIISLEHKNQNPSTFKSKRVNIFKSKVNDDNIKELKYEVMRSPKNNPGSLDHNSTHSSLKDKYRHILDKNLSNKLSRYPKEAIFDRIVDELTTLKDHRSDYQVNSNRSLSSMKEIKNFTFTDKDFHQTSPHDNNVNTKITLKNNMNSRELDKFQQNQRSISPVLRTNNLSDYSLNRGNQTLKKQNIDSDENKINEKAEINDILLSQIKLTHNKDAENCILATKPKTSIETADFKFSEVSLDEGKNEKKKRVDHQFCSICGNRTDYSILYLQKLDGELGGIKNRLKDLRTETWNYIDNNN